MPIEGFFAGIDWYKGMGAIAPISYPDVNGRAEPTDGEAVLCAAILDAWRLPTTELGPGAKYDHVHAALVVTIGSSASDSGRKDLPATALVRLLSLKNLLPEAYFGGIAIKYANILGPMVLNQLRLQHGLALTGVKITPGRYGRELLDKRSYDYALVFHNSDIQKRFVIANSVICGSTIITSTRSTAYFGIVDSTVLESCDPAAADANSGNEIFWVISSEFKGVFQITGNSENPVFDNKLKFDNNRLKDLSLEKLYLNNGVQISNNHIGTVNLQSIASRTGYKVESNRLEGDFSLQNGIETVNELMKLIARDDRKRSFDLIDNKIGGGIYFERSIEYAKYSGLKFTGNRIDLYSRIELQESWSGTLDLSSSEFFGNLQLRYSGGEYDKRYGDSGERRVDLPMTGPLPNEYCVDTDEQRNSPTSRQPITVSLDGARFNVFDWRLPFDCHVRWTGKGMVIGLWGMPNESYSLNGEVTATAGGAPSGPDEDRGLNAIDLVKRWRFLLAENDADALGAVSTYLKQHGEYTDSRSISEEAKRLNYAPKSCRPSDLFLYCLIRYPWRDGDQFWENLARAATLLFLAPGGYGAAPERALFCLFIGALFSFGVYQTYVWLVWRRYESALASILAFVERLYGEHGGLSYGTGVLRPIDISARMKIAIEQRKAGHDPQRWTPDNIVRFEDIHVDLQTTCAFIASQSRECEIPLAVHRDFEALREAAIGTSKVCGFSLFEFTQKPGRFTVFRYSVDAMLPVIDLHAYSRYYPEAMWMRAFAVTQHIIGWWWLTVFLASAAIL